MTEKFWKYIGWRNVNDFFFAQACQRLSSVDLYVAILLRIRHQVASGIVPCGSISRIWKRTDIYHITHQPQPAT